MSVRAAAWTAARLAEGLSALADRHGLVRHPDGRDDGAPRPGALAEWIDAAAASLGVEAEPLDGPAAVALQAITTGAPVVARLPAEQGFLLVTGRRRGTLLLLGPDLAIHRRSVAEVRAELLGGDGAEVERLLDHARLTRRRRARARAALLEERARDAWLEGAWQLRLPPGAPPRALARRARLGRRLIRLAACHALAQACFLGSWWIIGRAALEGQLAPGWLAAWALLLLSSIPFRLEVTASQGVVSFVAGGLLKIRLLAGALRLEPDEIRAEGSGQLLGRVLESEAVESLALAGGFQAALSGIELAAAFGLLVLGAGGALHAALLVAWIAFAFAVNRAFGRALAEWTRRRLDMTHELVENLLGHRTRLVQEPRATWHEGEDRALERYLGAAREMDRRLAWLKALVPRGWLLLGMAGVLVPFVSGGASLAAVALSTGAVLVAYQGLMRLVDGLAALETARVAWHNVAPLFHAAARPLAAPSPALAAAASVDCAGPLLEAEDLVYRHPSRAEPVLRGACLGVEKGDHVLLQGDSGAGKSTLAALLAGLRRPTSGLLLAGGLDPTTLGQTGWRRRVVIAPQFHENHILTATFGFNLLMGRRWPPTAADLAEARAVCGELGLDDLLGRMPAGMEQMVGESGWQLSHGEKSRVFLARALLQKTGVVILDETFAALDPVNLARCLDAARRRAQSLVVISHA